MIKEAIVQITSGNSLSRDEAVTIMREIMNGEATAGQIGAFLTALHLKGETIEELTGFATVMREKVSPVALPANLNQPVVDTCGTGGDGANTFNISTTAAFVVAGAGAIVAKHGNRAASSRCGSADVLEALGVNINLKPEQVTICLEEAGMGFMFAPLFHPSMKHAAPIRREIGIRTVFNLLGPMTNPAGVKRQVIGVPSKTLGYKIAAVLQQLGSEHALIIHSADGLDEISLAGETYLYEVQAGHDEILARTLQPEDYGFARHATEAVRGGSIQDNRSITLQVLAGKTGPTRDVTLFNAAAALIVAGLATDITHGIELATHSIDSGKAHAKLQELIKISQSFVPF